MITSMGATLEFLYHTLLPYTVSRNFFSKQLTAELFNQYLLKTMLINISCHLASRRYLQHHDVGQDLILTNCHVQQLSIITNIHLIVIVLTQLSDTHRRKSVQAGIMPHSQQARNNQCMVICKHHTTTKLNDDWVAQYCGHEHA